ncbi:MAG: TraR/DksA family transcriptional regulator [Nitrospirae bacterium]|nr:TraR/DksA family transcriptional regulator [Nitrospirota bacterium]
MGAAKKKAPAKIQKAAAIKKVTKLTASNKAVEAKVTKPQPAKGSAKAAAGINGAKQTSLRKTGTSKVEVRAKAKNAVSQPSNKSVVPQNKAATPKKGSVAAAPAERFRGLKSMLIAKRDSLLKEAKQEIQKYVSGENRQLVDTAIDEADWAAVEISEDINLKRLSAQRQLLNDVEESLRKVNEGTYGICEDCGEEISEKRLRVIPTATLCIDCKEQREKMAILDQDTEI